MGIASAKEGDDHVIFVNRYDTLKDAIKKAAYVKIGTLNNLPSIAFFGSAPNFHLGRLLNLTFLRSTQNS